MFRFQVGAVVQTITVEATALQVQSETNEISQTITGNQIANLATNGRNMLQLTTLVAGASSQMPDFDQARCAVPEPVHRFQRHEADDNNWLIDGGEAYDRGGGGILLVSPSQDAIGEFTITTSNYAADLGNSSGGMTSMVIKSGTSSSTVAPGSIIRNDALDAYNYLSKKSGRIQRKRNSATTYLVSTRRAGGVQVGQAQDILLLQPGMAPRDQRPKPNSHQGLHFGGVGRQHGGSQPVCWQCLRHTTDLGAPDDGSSRGGKIRCPRTASRRSIPKKRVPTSLIDSNAAAYIKAGYLLPPNQSDGLHYFSSATTGDYYAGRDCSCRPPFNEKFSVYGHLIYDSLSESAPIVSWTGNPFPTIGSLETVPSWTGVVHATMNLRPNLVNEIATTKTATTSPLATPGYGKRPPAGLPRRCFPVPIPTAKFRQSTSKAEAAQSAKTWLRAIGHGRTGGGATRSRTISRMSGGRTT